MIRSSILIGVSFSLAIGLLAHPASAESAQQIVNRMAQNELAAAPNDHSCWMYRDSNSENNKTIVEEVIQTPDGWVRHLLSVNGKPATPEEQKKNENEIQKLLTDQNYRRDQREKIEKDGQKATELLAMLPKAFLYKFAGRKNGVIHLSFRPNPKFHPPTREANVFHGMAGVLLIDAKEMRLLQLSGHLVRNIDFGGGILGKLSKGGTFEVDQANVGGDHWELTKLDVHISGHALFFATIKEQQHEIMTNFREVPPTTTLAEAVQMLKTDAQKGRPS